MYQIHTTYSVRFSHAKNKTVSFGIGIPLGMGDTSMGDTSAEKKKNRKSRAIEKQK